MKRIMSLVMAVIIATCMLVVPAFAVTYTQGKLDCSYTDGTNTYYGVMDLSGLTEPQLEYYNTCLSSDNGMIVLTYYSMYGTSSLEFFQVDTSNTGTYSSSDKQFRFTAIYSPLEFISSNPTQLENTIYKFSSATGRNFIRLDTTGSKIIKILKYPNFTGISSIPSQFKVTPTQYDGDLIFTDNTNSLGDRIDVENASSILSANSSFTFKQSDYNTLMDITKALQKSISALTGFSDTGVIVALEDIEITNFTPAVSGTEDSPTGTSGTFDYSVTLRKGNTTKVLSGLSGSITANEYILSEDRVSIITAVEILNNNKIFNFKQQDAFNQSNLAVSLKQSIQSLQGFSSTGVSVAVNIEEYQSAVDGTADNEMGIDGNYSSSVVLTKGIETDIVSDISGNIVASPYIPSVEPPKPPTNADLETSLNFMLDNFVYTITVVLPVCCLIFGIGLCVSMIPKIIKRFAKGA